MNTDLTAAGAEWIGGVPARWSIEPLGRWFRERRSTVSDSDFAPLSVTMHGIIPQLENVAKTDNNSNRKLVRKGDFAINSRSDRKGSAGVSELDGSVSVITTVLEPRGLDPRFTHHLLRSRPFQEEFYRWGHGIVDDLWSTKWSDMKSIKIPVPPESEQRAIADYLDRETAQIDAFIAKNEELIALLTERRAAAIDRAVAWGDTASAGAEPWLGRIPAGWSLAPLRRWVRFITSGSRGWGQFYSVEGADVFLRIGDLQRDRLELRAVERQRVDLPKGEEGVRAQAQKGDLLISITADLGSVAVIGPSDAGAYVSQHVALVRIDREQLNPRFGAYVVSSSAGKTHFEKAAYGGTKIQLSLPDVKEMPIAVPSLEVQNRIVEHLDSVTADVDGAIQTARKATALARERRAALISAAVTGKIDVEVAA